MPRPTTFPTRSAETGGPAPAAATPDSVRPEAVTGPPGAPTHLLVDLDALAANWRALAARAAPAACGAAVKADAYGLGLARVAPALAAAGCTTFFVAHLGEALDLRTLLPEAVVYVLHGPGPGDAAPMAEHALRPVLNDLGQVARWAEEARRRGRALPAALHLDTGINRLGLAPADARRLAAEPDRLAGVELALVMSHLACAEEAGHPLNGEQLARFRALAAALPPAPLSLANSAGIFLGGDYAFDLVRPGIGLYGARPVASGPNPMAEVVRLRARILQVREIDAPGTVGYGATRSVASGTRVATIAVGYADGMPRAASNRGWALLGGLRVPIVGRVSMDLITLDVTDVPPALAQPGATVDLIGNGLDLDDVAADAGTIAYEILTGLGPRYARHYLGGA